jgi:hypothetical protein
VLENETKNTSSLSSLLPNCWFIKKKKEAASNNFSPAQFCHHSFFHHCGGHKK